MNRRAFLRATATSTAALGLSAPGWAPAADALAADEILSGSQARIRQHRQGDVVIQARGADGKPIQGAGVRLEQTRHGFLFGCNCFGFDRIDDPDLERQYRERFTGLMNYATLPFYWAMYESERGRPKYDASTKAADWCREHGLRCKGHPLVWDEPSGSPRWLPADPAEVARLSHDRVREIVGRFKGRIDIWDVVNEPTQPNRKPTRMGQWSVAAGAVPYVRQHLEIARAAHREATLLVNDYSLGQPYYRILDALRQDGKPLFDAVGIQSHMHGGTWPWRRVWDVCETFARLGLPLHFTEATVVSGARLGPGEKWGPTTPELEAKQAEYVVQFYTLLFSHPAVQALTWWDFSDRAAWQGAAAGFLRRDMSPKPVYDRLLGLVKDQWWTRAQGRTDERGEFSARAFFGRHRVTVDLPGGAKLENEITFERGGNRRFEIVAG